MSLGVLIEAMQHDNLVNMDARTVLSCIPFSSDVLKHRSVTNRYCIADSLDSTVPASHSYQTILSWFTEQKFRYDMRVNLVPLKNVDGWTISEDEIYHKTHRYFSVIACSVEADNREVNSWMQPMVKAAQRGLIAFIIKPINGILHLLIQAKVEPGNFDVVEMAPTVQCITGSYEHVPQEHRPPYLDYVLNAPESQILFDTYQSEEGGRFYQEQNWNMVVMAGDEFPNEIDSRYIWLTFQQLKHFIQYNNFVNVQARCLLSCIDVTGL
jgi:dTDP-4-dehydro-6-deoxy-alpha-D-glucopyranose 2,3-dehydratase